MVCLHLELKQGILIVVSLLIPRAWLTKLIYNCSSYQQKGTLTIGGSLFTLSSWSANIENAYHFIEATVQLLSIRTESEAVRGHHLILTEARINSDINITEHILYMQSVH